MKASLYSTVSALSAAMIFGTASSFQPSTRSFARSVELMEQQNVCDAPDLVSDSDEAAMDPTTLGRTLRAAKLTNAAGELVELGDFMGSKNSVPRLEAAGASGPLFVSIGDKEKLNTFLDVNPSIPRDQMFVDGYNFEAYIDAGFGKFNMEDAKGAKTSAPKLNGFGGWWKYLSNVAKVSPIEPGKSGVPEGVLRLGGTFVLHGDKVAYHWKDKIPGDHPEFEDVMAFVER